MADNTVLNTGTGGDTIATDDIAGVKHQRVKVGSGADGTYNDATATNPIPTSIAQGGTTANVVAIASGGNGLEILGVAQPNTTGTITTSTSTVTTGSLSKANVISVFIRGTHAGINVTFEASDDNTNWSAIQGVRNDTGELQTTSGVLPANTTRAWSFTFAGQVYFRVRATAYTSGTANVIIDPGTMPVSPVIAAVTQPPTRTPTMFVADAASGSTTIGLITLTPYRSMTAAATGTSMTITAGTKFRVSSINVTLYNSSAAVNQGKVELRFNTGGAVATGSPLAWSTGLATAAATANAGYAVNVTIPDGALEFAGGTQIGVTQTSGATTARYTLSIFGYEY